MFFVAIGVEIKSQRFDLVLATLAMSVFLVVVDLLAPRSLTRSCSKLANITDRPVVYACGFEEFVGLCPEKDYNLWHERYERIASVLALAGEKPPEVRVSPDVMMVFTDNRAKAEGLGQYLSGNEQDFHFLTGNCRVVWCEMFIPTTKWSMQTHKRAPVSLAAGWQLVHGSSYPFLKT